MTTPEPGAPSAGLVDQVLDSFTQTPSPRVRTVLRSLVRHLHAFIAEAQLSEDEWLAAIDFLTRTGQACTAARQEFILLSDVLGASMATVAANHAGEASVVTASTVLGPFFVEGAPEVALGADIANGAVGQPCHVSGTVRGSDGAPLAGARVEVWEADEDGLYDVQRDPRLPANRACLTTDADGGYRFWSVRPAPYPIPCDGPVGELLAATARSPMRPAHIHFKVSAPGRRTLITHVFAAGDDHLRSDAVFGVRDGLVREFVQMPPGLAPEGRQLDESWSRVRFDMVLAAAPG